MQNVEVFEQPSELEADGNTTSVWTVRFLPPDHAGPQSLLAISADTFIDGDFQGFSVTRDVAGYSPVVVDQVLALPLALPLALTPTLLARRCGPGGRPGEDTLTLTLALALALEP